MTLQELLAHIESGESLEVEYKAALGGVPKNLWETVSAFANTAGGWILLGVANDLTVQGLNNSDAIRQDLVNALRNPQKISRDPCGVKGISIEDIDGAKIVAMHIRAAPSREKPVYINGNPYQGTFVRRNEGDYRCTKHEVDRMIRDAGVDGADSTIVRGYSWEHIDRETFKRYRFRYQSLNENNPKTTYDDNRFMRAIGGYRKDAETGDEGFTRAAILMFGTDEAIQSLRPRHLIDFRRVGGPGEQESRWEDRLAFEGNLYEAFFQIYPRLTAPLEIPFKLEGPHRLTATSAHEALREGLVNMLVHADYSEQAALLVKASPREFVFRNPGSSRIPEEDLLTGDRSDPRNPLIIKMFRHISLAEEAGTGVPKIIRIWRKAGLELPSIASETERYEFTLMLRLVHLLSEEDRNWLSACLIETVRDSQLSLPGSEKLELSQNEQLVLIQAKNAGSITNATIQALTGLHKADVTPLLTGLKDRGLLDRESSGRWATYKVPPRLMSRFQRISINKNDKELHGPIKKTSASDKLINKIVRLCSHPRSAAQIAKSVKKNRIYLVNQYLSPLVKNGKLKYTNPNSPKARNQKYISA